MNGPRDEFILIYTPKNMDNLHEKIERASKKRLDSSSRAILRRNSDSLKVSGSSGRQRFRYMEFALPNGSLMAVLMVERKIETFYLQEAIRENFGASLKNCLHVRYNIMGLSKADQRRSVEALVLLEEMQKRPAPTFKKEGPRESMVVESKFYTTLTQKDVNILRLRSKRMATALSSVIEDNTLPYNQMDGAKFIKKCVLRAKKLNGVKCEVWRKKRLANEGAGGFLAVAQAAKHESTALVKLVYRHPKAERKIALVGKGIAYDTGGMNLKTEGSMSRMHTDKTGASVAMAAFEAAVKSRLKLEITCWLAVTENNISSNAYRPSDVVKTASGLTVEVQDTDAEGRMVLADTLHFASRENPDMMIDLATLTGTIPGAVGPGMAGIFCKNRKFLFGAEAVSRECGERVWPFPMENTTFRETTETELADILQCNEEEHMHIFGAQFLSNFVPEKIKWMHVDLAAEHSPCGLGIVESPVTGHGTRFVFSLLENAKRFC